MLSYIVKHTSHAFVFNRVIPHILYSNNNVWIKKNDKLVLLDIVFAFADEPEILDQLFKQHPTVTYRVNKESCIQLLSSYKPPYEFCRELFIKCLQASILNTALYKLFVEHYPQLSTFINEYNIKETSLYNMFPNIPVPALELYNVQKLLHDINEYRYINSIYPHVIELTPYVARHADIEIVKELVDLGCVGDVLGHWRVYGSIPKVDGIVDLEAAYYIRKYDVNLWNNTQIDIYTTHLPFGDIDMNTDFDIIVDILTVCDKFILQGLLARIYDEVTNNVLKHWLNCILISLGVQDDGIVSYVSYDDCYACKYMLSRLNKH